MKRCLIFAVLWMLGFGCLSAQAALVRGQVVDENGVPVDGVILSISAFEERRDGQWILVHYSGEPSKIIADSNGYFVLPFQQPYRYDLQFHKQGFAPAFLFQFGFGSPESKVVLKRGEIIHGIVSQRIDGNLAPVAMERVVLQLPSRGFWYQEKVLTDLDGRFEFRVCAPPDEPGGLKRKWQVVVAGKVVEIDVRDGEPVDEVNFEIDVKVKKQPNKQE
jgi:hypothetical protein